MERITRADVERAARAHTRALAALGIDAPRFTVDKGSATNGIAWRLWPVDPETGRPAGINPPVGASAIGHTARAAYDEITSRTSILWDVRSALLAAGYDLPAIADVDDAT